MKRVLHVVDTLGAGGIETTFLNVVRAWRRDPAWAAHDVLACAGGILEEPFRAAGAAVTVTARQGELERALTRGYDIIHFLIDRSACRMLPFAVAQTRAAVVYGKGYDLAGTFRLNDGLAWQPDESLLWGADAATFTTSALAAGYAMPADRGEVLGKAADVRHFLAVPEVDASTPLRIVCVANLHALKRLGDLIAAVARLRRELPGVRVRLVGADPGR